MEEMLWGGYRMQWEQAQFRLSTDSMVLADFCALPRRAAVCDLGCGCGSLSLLLCAKYPDAHLTGVELQPSAAALAQRNIETNALQDRMEVICGDLRAHRALLSHSGFDAVVSNPPYYPVGSGKQSSEPLLATARTELTCTLDELCACAAWLLKSGGRFFLVHKPERLADVICALRLHRLEPKRIRFVRHRVDAPISLVLLESRLDANVGLSFESDLALYHPDGTESADFRRIYHHQED